MSVVWMTANASTACTWSSNQRLVMVETNAADPFQYRYEWWCGDCESWYRYSFPVRCAECGKARAAVEAAAYILRRGSWEEEG